MKRIVLILLLCMIASPAFAGVSCTLPFTLTNGTIADATQVMANYNALVTCLTRAAAAGANSDITSLNGLTTPLAPIFGGTPVYTGATSSGSANAQTVTGVPPFIANQGNILTFKAGFSNTGPLTVNGTNVFRLSQLGATMTVGGEIIAGQQVILEYDGTQFQCMSCGVYHIGESKDFTTPTIPAGWAIENGTCVSTTTYADLFSLYGSSDIWSPGSTGGACAGGQFHLPYANGSASVAYDTQGSVTANKLTNAGSSCAATSVGVNCGLQNRTIGQGNLPNYNLAVTDPGHTHGTGGSAVFYVNGSPGVGNFNAQSGGTVGVFNLAATGSATTGISVNTGGSGIALATVPPVFTVIKAVKY